MLLSIYPNELNIYIHTKACIWMLIVVVQSLSHVRLCDPMDCSTPGLPVLHHLPELAQTHVHWVSDAIQPFHSLSLSSAFSLSQHQRLFQWVGCSNQVARVMELQLQHQSFQWNSGLISFRMDWLQSPSAMILEPQKIKSYTVSTVSSSISHEVMGLKNKVWHCFHCFPIYFP